MSVLCRNSLTDAQVRFAQAALRGLEPAWSLDCCESCEADWFLDLSSTRSDGRAVSFIIHARDGAVHVVGMVDDDHNRLGCFDDMAHAIGAVIAAIMTGPG
jgi:hypothetical protein